MNFKIINGTIYQNDRAFAWFGVGPVSLNPYYRIAGEPLVSLPIKKRDSIKKRRFRAWEACIAALKETNMEFYLWSLNEL